LPDVEELEEELWATLAIWQSCAMNDTQMEAVETYGKGRDIVV
jgi:hypothetical protein